MESPAASPAAAQGSAPARGERGERALEWTLAFAAAALFFHRAAFTGAVFIQRDMERVYAPMRQYWASRVRSLELPEWYPFDGLGQSFVGITVNGAFHPANLLHLLLPLGPALTLNVLLAYAGALMGMYRLGRHAQLQRPESSFAAIAYGFSGYLVGISNNLAYLMAAATLPWVALHALRCREHPTAFRVASASAVLALVMLAGDPQGFYLGVILTLALVVTGRTRTLPWRMGVGLLVVLSAAGLAAAQILPSLEVKREARGGNGSLKAAQFESGHPLRIAEAFVGPFFLDAERSEVLSDEVSSALEPELGSPWVDSQYVGALVLLLAVGGILLHRRRWETRWSVMAWVALACVWLGKYTIFYGLLYRFAPLWNSFRYPQKVTPLLLVGVCLAAAHGLAGAASSATERRWLCRALGVGSAVLLILAWGEHSWHLLFGQLLPRLWKEVPPLQHQELANHFIRWTLQSGALLSCGALVLARVNGRTLRAALLAAAVATDLYVAHENLYWVTAPAVLTEAPSLVKVLKEREGELGPGRFRVLSLAGSSPKGKRPPGWSAEDFVPRSQAEALRPDIGALFGLETLDAYLPAASTRLEAANLNRPEDFARFNTRYLVVTEAQALRMAGSPLTAEIATPPGMGLRLLELTRAQPRAYLASGRCVQDESHAMERWKAQGWRAESEVLVECGGGPGDVPSSQAAASGEVRILRYQPERVEVDVQTKREAWLVLNDAYASGWKATEDGKPVVIRPTNAVVRGVSVPSGRHRVVFSYRTPGLRKGLAISAGTLLILLAVTGWRSVAVQRRDRTKWVKSQASAASMVSA